MSRQVWAGITLVLVSLLLAGVGAAFLARGGPSDAGPGPSPGFERNGRTVDTSPFELAGPSDGGSVTTLPESFFGVPDGSSDTSDPSDPLAPSTTTTTTSPVVPKTPTLVGVASLCGFSDQFGSFYGLLGATPAETQRLVTGLVPLMDRYVDVAPTDVRADVAALRAAVVDVRRVLEANGWNFRAPDVEAAIARLSSAGSGSVASQLGRVVAKESATCR